MQSLEYLSQQELVVDGLCETCADPHAFLGGLGVEKTREIAEERSGLGKCGNITCREALATSSSRRSAPHAVHILNTNREVVSATELDQFCGEACFLSFRALLASRPTEDVWNLQLRALKFQEQQHPPLGNPVVREVKERPTKKKTKSVSFASKLVSAAAPPRHDEGDSDVEHNMLNFLEPVNLAQLQLSLFGSVCNHLLEVCTGNTRRVLQGEQLVSLPPNSDERLGEVLRHLMGSLEACNVAGSPTFKLDAELALEGLIHTLNLSQGIPRRISGGKQHWMLLTCVLLSALAESGRFPAQYEFDKNDVVSCCFTEVELKEIDADSFAYLKSILVSV